MLKVLCALVFSLTWGCTKTSTAPQTPVQQGRMVYNTQCISCHGPNPHVDGSIGPAIYGASLDLIEHRVLHTDYPAGYSPKRATHIMPALPFLKDEIPALHAYLNSP